MMGTQRIAPVFLLILTILLTTGPLRGQGLKDEPVVDRQFASVFALWAGGSQRDAERAIAQLKSNGPVSTRVEFFDALLTRTRTGPESSVEDFDRIAKREPDSVESRCARIIFNLDSNTDVPNNLRELEQLAGAHPDDPLLIWSLAWQYRALEREQECLAQLQKLLPFFNPGPAQFHQLFANALDTLDRHSEALPHRMKALELETGAWSNAGVGYTLRQLGRYNESAEYFEKAVAIYPAADHFWGWGTTLYEARKYTEAIEKLRRATEESPTLPGPYNTWGCCAESLGHWEEALDLYRKSMKLDEKYAAPARNAVHLLRSLGRDDEADTIEAKWKSTNPNTPLNGNK
jgi:tetratricopeptide (TPR) repeat protein